VRWARTVRVSAVSGIIVVATFGIRNAAAQGTTDLSAQGILARSALTYAHCTSYQDTGAVTITYLESLGKRVEERPFKTAFVRPDRFRFEYRETGLVGATRRYIVWRLGSHVQTWWDVRPGVQEKGSLSSALSAATGVSGGSAHTIPALLLPDEVEGRRLTDMTDVKRIADAEVGGAGCFCVEGTYANVSRTVCIDRKTFLVRRVEFESVFPSFRAHETTTYEPSVDEPVARESLAFDPPVQR
jgi:hypothetical protein